MIRMSMIRVILPPHLRTLAQVGSEVKVEVKGQVTQRSVLDALEATYPMLRGTIRDHTTQQRRPFLRFFACEEDLSHEPPDAPLPEAVASGKEPPEDPSLRDVAWTSALLFTAATGAVVAIAELMGRQAAEIGWHRVTGKRPPKPRKR